jgi:hypothetical protein
VLCLGCEQCVVKMEQPLASSAASLVTGSGEVKMPPLPWDIAKKNWVNNKEYHEDGDGDWVGYQKTKRHMEQQAHFLQGADDTTVRTLWGLPSELQADDTIMVSTNS